MKILCDRCKKEFDYEEEVDIYAPENKRRDILCPDCQEDADLE